MFVATTINIQEAKTHLLQLLIRVEAGEEIVIARAGKPVARLVAVRESKKQLRLGALKGQIWMAPDWNAPDEELIDLLENSKIFPE